MFERILVATDFSQGAAHAREVAMEWAVRGRSAFELVHVVEPVSSFFLGAGSWLTDDFTTSLAQDVEVRFESELSAVRALVPDAMGAILHGVPHRELVARATAIGADLVVIGAAGHAAVERPLLGSTAERVVRGSSVPVLVVPAPTRAMYALPRVIVVPSDLSGAAKDAIARIGELARELGARVELVHAFDVPSFASPKRPRGQHPERELARELERSHPVGGLAVHVHVEDGAPARVIAKVAEDTSADLVAMASSGRGRVSSLLLGGVTDRVVKTSDVPVLVFPERH